jgi:tetratricopeptide (TPR) repeat protein
VLTAVLLALQLAAPGGVAPEDAKKAMELARRSGLEYDLGHAEDALRDIEQAYLLDPAPGLLFNLGQCHKLLKHWEQAETAYRNYLHHRPNAPNRATVLQLIDEVHRAQLAAAPVPAQPPAVQPAPAAPPPTMISVPLVTTAPAPAPPEAVAAQATEPAPAKPVRAGPWVFVATAVVAAGVAVAGFWQMANYSSLQASSKQTPVSLQQAQSAESNYAWGEPAGIAGAAVAVGSVAGAIWTF